MKYIHIEETEKDHPKTVSNTLLYVCEKGAEKGQKRGKKGAEKGQKIEDLCSIMIPLVYRTPLQSLFYQLLMRLSFLLPSIGSK